MCEFNRSCCGAFWTFFLFVSLIGALVTPWTFSTLSVKVNGVPVCGRLLMRNWDHAYCYLSVTDPKCPIELQDRLTCPLVTSKWYVNFLGDKEKFVFNVTTSLTAFSGIFALIIFVTFLSRACCLDNHRTSLTLILLTLFGALSLIAALFYFAFALTGAVQTDVGGTCPNDITHFLYGICNSFSGSKNEIYDNDVLITIKWGPLGWIVSVVAIFLFSIVTFIVVGGKKEPSKIQLQNVDNDSMLQNDW